MSDIGWTPMYPTGMLRFVPPSWTAAIAAAQATCADWGLTGAETERLVAGDARNAAAVVRIDVLLRQLYSPPLPAIWMITPNRNPVLGGSEDAPVRPIDYAINTPDGLWDVLALVEAYAQGK